MTLLPLLKNLRIASIFNTMVTEDGILFILIPYLVRYNVEDYYISILSYII